MTKSELFYEGKGKKLFRTENENFLIAEFKDDLTAFNAQKKSKEHGKGDLNCKISGFLFNHLIKNNISTHFVKILDSKNMLVRKVKIIPIEVVVRNVATGSLSKRLGIPNGKIFSKEIVEFYYKDDNLNDPIINDEHVLMMELVDSQEEIDFLKKEARKINDLLLPFFAERGLRLIDFKLEFGKNIDGDIILADEISPDSCRFWDVYSGESYDKDRFRKDIGKVKVAYEEVLTRILGDIDS